MNEITLQNFRCYSSLHIKFKSGINLIIGDNATGKTSLLRACKYVLSSFFCGFSDNNTKWITPNNDDFQMQYTDQGILLQERPIHIQFDIADIMTQQHLMTSTITTFTLIKNSKKNSRALTSGIRDYKNYANNILQQYISSKGQQIALPLFASFSTEDIHTNRKINATEFKHYTHKPSFGYYECLEGDGFFPYWIKRLLILQEKSIDNIEATIVRTAIQTALGKQGCNIIQDMHIRPNQGKVYFLLMDGREIDSDHLSDGYRRLINIIIDLAFRCAILNHAIYHEEACIHTQGTVLIDEIDLHLHPSLQALVLKSLQITFPKIQFIVASHAPMVMSNVESNDQNIVYKLYYDSTAGYSTTPVNTYGLDLSTLTEVILEQTPRSNQVDKELKHLFNLITDERYSEASQCLHTLQEKYRDNLPELSQAEAMLYISTNL